MKKFLIVPMLMMAFAANAASTQSVLVEFGSLPDQEKALVREALAPEQKKEEIKPDQLERWANAGKSIGEGLGAAAKEMGVAVTEFAKTDVGKITTAVLVWKFMAKDIVELAGTLIVNGVAIVFMIVFCTVFAKARAVKFKTIKVYSKENKNIFGNFTVESEVTEPVRLDENQEARDIAGMVIGVIGFVICLLVLIA